MRYIADKNNLLGTTPKERARANMLETKISEAKGAFTGKCYSPNSEELFAAYPETRDKNLKDFENLLSKTKWIVGDNLTYVDFSFYE
ncbi:glutathione S-transferase family protein, partial [Salmonella sp. s54836]|uniref:glutathione S-transferase family protein n=1 Tax=Salmonella sp. s54836 TaxID=3159673 RepID=UPI00397FE23D